MSLAKQKKVSRRQMILRDEMNRRLTEQALTTLAAILLEHDGTIVIPRENFLLVKGLRVDSRVDDKGRTVVTLQDQSGRVIDGRGPTDQPLHDDADRGADATPDDARQTETVHGV